MFFIFSRQLSRTKSTCIKDEDILLYLKYFIFM